MIDLASDVKTRPSAAMRQAMANAEVGDEQAFEDPTVNALCERAAALLGKESALFAPSGAMCNQLAIATWCRPGDEVICERTAHIAVYEAGGPAANAGVMMHAIHGERGQFTAAQLQASFRAKWRHCPQASLVCVEQTANLGGGSVWPLTQLNEVAALAHDRGLRAHMDGARLLNASAATGIAACDYAAQFDSVWLDFSKGLGAPIGACLAGSREFIERAWVIKQRLGGAMRQAGIVAAGALYALDHHVERLVEDHVHARRLAVGLAALPGVLLDATTVETNIVFFRLDVAHLGFDAHEFSRRLAAHGVRIGAFDECTLRAVTHLDVSATDIGRCLDAAAAVLFNRQA
ncbi:MAG: low specificity L-threonine aldolase [Xanthomonadales bacterium]|nr:low specificity L-threonine aldolase [Xanthomonadales bacterium]